MLTIIVDSASNSVDDSLKVASFYRIRASELIFSRLSALKNYSSPPLGPSEDISVMLSSPYSSGVAFRVGIALGSSDSSSSSLKVTLFLPF